MGAPTLLPPKTSGHRRKPDRSHHSRLRCHQRHQDLSPKKPGPHGPLAGHQSHSPDSKGAEVSSLPESRRRLWAAGFSSCFCVFHGAEAGRNRDGGGCRLGTPSYTLLTLTLFLGRRGLVLAAIGGRWLAGRAGAAAGGWQEVGRLQDGLGVLASLHAQGGHTGRAGTLAAVGREEGEPHGVRDAARAQRAPWKEEAQEAAITVRILSPRTCGGSKGLIHTVGLDTQGPGHKCSGSGSCTAQETQRVVQGIVRASETCPHQPLCAGAGSGLL